MSTVFSYVGDPRHRRNSTKETPYCDRDRGGASSPFPSRHSSVACNYGMLVPWRILVKRIVPIISRISEETRRRTRVGDLRWFVKSSRTLALAKREPATGGSRGPRRLLAGHARNVQRPPRCPGDQVISEASIPRDPASSQGSYNDSTAWGAVAGSFRHPFKQADKVSEADKVSGMFC